MTLNKKTTPISRHKTGTTHQAAAKAGPSPQAFDIIPRGQVKPSATSRPVIAPSQPGVADNTLTQPSAAPQLQLQHRAVDLKPSPGPGTPAAAESPDDSGSVAPKEQGVSVADLLAKRSEAEKAPQPVAGQPVSQAKPSAVPTPDSQAAEAAQATPVLEVPDRQPEEDHSVARALKDDTAEPQEHSDSLKEAMKDLDGDPEGRPHHEMFGGKPVIVVHKDHHTSGLMWFVWFIACLLLAVLAVNFLLDAEVISTTYDIPYTDFL